VLKFEIHLYRVLNNWALLIKSNYFLCLASSNRRTRHNKC